MSIRTSKRYYLKKPTGKRKSISIYLQTVNSDSSTSNETVKDPDIRAINLKLKTGAYTVEAALAHAEKVRLRLNESLGAIAPYKTAFNQIGNKHNYKLLEEYWKQEYSYRQVVDESTAYHKLRRAVEAIENLSLASASRQELTLKIKGLDYSIQKKRVITSSLNQLLRFAGREFKLIPPKKVKAKVQYLTPEEFEAIMLQIDNEQAETLCRAAFLTGGRQGEVYAFKASDIKGTSIYIQTQITEDEEEKAPKWGSIRPAYAFHGTLDLVKKIDQYRNTNTLPTRNKLRKDFSRACMKAFPTNKDKHCTFHDLRHSYAIRLLSLGVILDLVSQSLGNSVAVCQEYYAGYVLTYESLTMIDKIVREAK